MSDNTSRPYDVAIIGAGIAGSMAAFVLKQMGQRVLLLDRSSIPASGGSGAAGAFSSIIPLWTAGNGTRSVTKRIQF